MEADLAVARGNERASTSPERVKDLRSSNLDPRESVSEEDCPTRPAATRPAAGSLAAGSVRGVDRRGPGGSRFEALFFVLSSACCESVGVWRFLETSGGLPTSGACCNWGFAAIMHHAML